MTPVGTNMELRTFSLTGYKGYAEKAQVEVAPLTILVGPNNAGKTALAQALQLLAGGLAAPDDVAGEPLLLQSGGFRHGDSFEDLVTGRAVHGLLRMSITLACDAGESSLDLAVRNVVEPARPSWRRGFALTSTTSGIGPQGFATCDAHGASAPLRSWPRSPRPPASDPMAATPHWCWLLTLPCAKRSAIGTAPRSAYASTSRRRDGMPNW